MKRSELKRKTRIARGTASLSSRSPLRAARRRKADYDTAAWREGLGPNLDPHHIIYAQTLRAHGLHAYLADLRNRLPIAREAHLNHHSGSAPIPRELLPASVFEFADEVGLCWWLDKHYPATVSEGESVRRLGGGAVGASPPSLSETVEEIAA